MRAICILLIVDVDDVEHFVSLEFKVQYLALEISVFRSFDILPTYIIFYLLLFLNFTIVSRKTQKNSQHFFE